MRYGFLIMWKINASECDILLISVVFFKDFYAGFVVNVMFWLQNCILDAFIGLLLKVDCGVLMMRKTYVRIWALEHVEDQCK